MRSLLIYLKPYWKQALIAPLLMVLEVTMDLLQPHMMQRIVDDGIRVGNQPLVFETGLVMLIFALLGAVGGIGCTIFAVRAAINFGADLRSSLYRKIQSLSFGNLDQLGTGQLVTDLTNDVTQVQDVVLIALRILVRVPLIVVGSLVMAYLTSPQLALIALPLLVPLALLLWWIIRRAHPLYRRLQACARPGQYRHAGEPGRGARDQSVRARGTRKRALRRRQQQPDDQFHSRHAVDRHHRPGACSCC